MIRSVLFVAFTFSVSALLPVQDERSANSIMFTIRNAGMDVTGMIGGIKAEINFQPDELERSSIIASAQAATVSTGISIRDKHLMKMDYFDASNHQLIHLRSKQFRKKSKNQFEGVFDLTIKNITKEVIIPLSLSTKEKTIFIQGSFEINRLDFKLGEKSTVLDDKVVIQLKGPIL